MCLSLRGPPVTKHGLRFWCLKRGLSLCWVQVGAEKGGGGEEEGKVESSKGDLITGESHQKGSYDDDRHHDREADQEDDQEEEEKIHSHSHRRRWQPSGCLSWMRSRRLQWHKVRPQRTNKKPLFVSCSSARRC
ncbi:hypothetical protein CDL15_Pgr020411 [Punica granatum]|uniref:Uncharacterized protein n=1 Tax=Punica granatum TaxID=22663 RepID=A0A218VV70_PUNGR|nr:hypothetical protein CDL15_Pgr020411 [Punica granatum]